MDAQGVYEEAQRRLDAADPRLKFRAVRVGVQPEEEWWYVPVVPETADGRIAPRFFAIHILAGVERQMYEELGLNILFVPLVWPEESEKPVAAVTS